MAWAAVAKVTYPLLDLLYAIPNGFRAGGATARDRAIHVNKMKAEGLRPGVPDMCLPVQRGGYGAMYIEHKSDDGTVSDDQQWWIKRLRDAGNHVIVSRSFAESRDAVLAYLNLG